MKNYEKYENEIRKYNGDEFCVDFVQPYILKENGCASINCEACFMYQMIWLLKDYEEIKEPEEPEVDWSKIKVDTPVLVKNKENEEWKKRHFAKYKNGNVYAWNDGRTSWTAYDKKVWEYAKLAENEKECKESKVDWSKVEVDTPILVRDIEDGKWLERYFAKFEDGKVYAWLGENTSYTASSVAKWKYAKLAESEEE